MPTNRISYTAIPSNANMYNLFKKIKYEQFRRIS